MPDDQHQDSKVYCLSLRPRERRSVVEALTDRRVLQLIRAAPRAESTLSALVSPAKAPSAAAYPRGSGVEGAALMPDGQRQRSKA